jgi:hypothetical protein
MHWAKPLRTHGTGVNAISISQRRVLLNWAASRLPDVVPKGQIVVLAFINRLSHQFQCSRREFAVEQLTCHERGAVQEYKGR